MDAHETWRQSPDLISGMEFFATLQLRTPLRVLTRHGEIHTNLKKSPPKIIRKEWQGIWVIKIKTWKELGGADIAEFAPGECASDIGPAPNNGRYLRFLIAVRTVVESSDRINVRANKLRQLLDVEEWREFVERHGRGNVEAGISTIMAHIERQ